ncbi:MULTISPECIES: phosphosulfolactate synthase [Brevibacillus]|uniref:phosphosulfolactate synthase n=1 Tax=Brevibacillus TaxID=55080 RepID=UPI0002A4FE25|nr:MULTISPECIES: phosphosulfolactate synthase [Brevibacillus]ELK43747.1 phosphosulfolactate synthase [Brevibacillus agri BAB-2500]MBG9568837.1 DNA mismatch repair protein MutT [Brevibacillus agri]MCG5249867.1 phosphosulfolactate synthase [Brevibacillus agri]MDN4091560.1 phosphosulfolactate synthase [Brevibacillus agri]MED4569122.1 phosphosulfolactate synthase [Brevibacillus agri]
MVDCEHPFLPPSWANPSGRMREKPRQKGLTMVIDKGLGLTAYFDLLDLASPYMDIYKLGFGTTALYPPKVLRQKLDAAKAHGLHIMPGGTFFEVAIRHSTIKEYMQQIRSLGFSAVEISDGTFPLPFEKRKEAIALGVDAGLIVYTEVGKKAAGYRAQRQELLETLDFDLTAGASYVIVEARESGTVGVFDGNGKVDHTFLRDIVWAAQANAERLIWEAPQKDQQVGLIQALGSDVNLGNIACTDVLSVETLRRGLRGDTALIMEEGRSAPCE